MADLLHRTTKQLLRSVNTPDFVPTWKKGDPAPLGGDWIVNPDLVAVNGSPAKYWKLDVNKVALMDAAEQAVVDATDASAAKAAEIGASKALVDDDRLIRAIAKVIADEGGTSTQDQIIAALKAAIDAEP